MHHSQRERLGEKATAEAVAALTAQFGNKIVTSDAARAQHAHTTTWLAPERPDAVLFAEAREEVVAAVNICRAHDLPIVPFGTGSSLEGHTNAPFGGLSIDLTPMKRVLEVFAEDMAVRVEPGVTRVELNEQIRDTGLFFPIDPGAEASLGGMAATRASGTNAVRYGTMKDVTLALEVVRPDGKVIRTAHRAKKSSAGYDLTRLFVGSEGTLGVITELTLKLFGVPEQVGGGVCGFPTVRAACEAVIQTIQYGIPIARIELLDAAQIRACNTYSNLQLTEQPTLFVEFHGSPASVKEQADLFEGIVADCGGSALQWTVDEADRGRLWAARHNVYWASKTLRPGSSILSTDACVPISRLADCVAETEADIANLGYPAPIVGHVGDGNFHVQLMVDMESPEEVKKAEDFTRRLAERAIAMDGTCTGEHGIGQGKAKYMRTELGDAVDTLRAIKQALDPQNLMNPGKMGL